MNILKSFVNRIFNACIWHDYEVVDSGLSDYIIRKRAEKEVDGFNSLMYTSRYAINDKIFNKEIEIPCKHVKKKICLTCGKCKSWDNYVNGYIETMQLISSREKKKVKRKDIAKQMWRDKCEKQK